MSKAVVTIAIRFRFDFESTSIRFRFDCDSTPFDSHSTADRPRYDRSTTRVMAVCGLLQCVIEASGLCHCDLNDLQ